MTPRSTVAIENVRTLCEEHLKGRYNLEVVDIYEVPELAAQEDIIGAPTLIKHLPLPLRRFIGSMSDNECLLRGLDLPVGTAIGSGGNTAMTASMYEGLEHTTVKGL